ncbi:MAG TPA: nitrilase-related carbon-nitrogen hydrolase, partial [Longimicrobiales bacterium]|nr:nitrilase-related carbon-nitrogen hydrolase [Longimicrobiales bacterium]
MTDFSTSTLRLAVSQHAPHFGMVAENAARIRELARSCDADLLLTPELSLTGYDVRDLVHELALSPLQVSQLLALEPGTAVATGFIESSATGVPYNSA